MKIVINENESSEELEIVINCKSIDEQVLRIIESIKSNSKKLTVNLDNEIFVLDINDVYYFESVDKKTFVYTENEVYNISLRLYEIEEKYIKSDFFRASKSSIINISKIKRIKTLFGGKVEVLLENKERLIVSRQYVPVLKEKIDY